MNLDDAYANGAYIAGAADYPPRWQTQAAAFRAGLGDRARLDLRYGPGDRHRFDLFTPTGAAPRGTVIFIHGGYWRAFDKSSWSHLAAGPLARGWAVAMPSYDLCPQVRIDRITLQIRDAVQAVADLCPGPLSITGHSAGGHLSARMLDRALLPQPVAARLHHVLPISPLSDLDPLRHTSMNADFGLDAASARAESPVHMTDRHACPVTVWVGGAERPAFLDQARWLARAWGGDHVVAPDRHHFDVIDPLAQPESDLVRRLTA